MLSVTFFFGSARSWGWQWLGSLSSQGRRPDLLLKDWEGGKDLFIDVVGSSPLAVSNFEGFVPGGASRRAVVQKEGTYRDTLRAPLDHVLHLFV
jgi:hypothetical protein